MPYKKAALFETAFVCITSAVPQSHHNSLNKYKLLVSIVYAENTLVTVMITMPC